MHPIQNVVVLGFACLAPVVSAGYVEPLMGGGQVIEGLAPMKHADISFDGVNLSVEIDPTVDTPVLRPLTPPDEFDPQGTWGMINGHAYNFQYGWNAGLFDAWPPSGHSIWIKQLDASPELKVYQRPPASPEGEPIFGSEGSPVAWRWSEIMTHNLYAVQNPVKPSYFATYEVYFGHSATGDPHQGYNAAQVTFHFVADVPRLGDYDRDQDVDADDYRVWRSSYGQAGEGLAGDGNGDQTVNAADYTVWRDNLTENATPLSGFASVPEPAGLWLLAAAPALCGRRRAC